MTLHGSCDWQILVAGGRLVMVAGGFAECTNISIQHPAAMKANVFSRIHWLRSTLDG